MTNYDELTEEQADALDKAALHVINARKEAAEMLRGSGVEPRDSGLLGPCSMLVLTPRPPHTCGCDVYVGVDGGPFRTRFQGPDLGSGPITITCNHPEAAHISL
jgi:Family of unknown function (DUF6422)